MGHNPHVGSRADWLQTQDFGCRRHTAGETGGSGTGGGHVGIYLGGDDMIDASSTQGKIRYSYGISGSSYWTRNFICGKRPLT